MTMLRLLGDKMLAALVPATEAKAGKYYNCWRMPGEVSGPNAQYCCYIYGKNSVYCNIPQSQIYG
ncbi:MAG: hypothetical protein AAGC49_14265 [Brevundimonas sp.]